MNRRFVSFVLMGLLAPLAAARAQDPPRRPTPQHAPFGHHRPQSDAQGPAVSVEAGAPPGRAADELPRFPDESPRFPLPDLLAHAAEDQYWIAQTLPAARATTPARSGVRVRQRATNRPWERVIVLNGRAIDLSHRGSSVAILLADGQWLFAWPQGSSTGRGIPGAARIRALASDGDTLWAAAITDPAELANPAEPGNSTRPATQPVETPWPGAAADDHPRLMLFALENGQWSPRDTLPGNTPTDSPISLGVRAGKPVVALLTAWRRLLILRRTDAGWEAEPIDAGYDIRAFRLLQDAPSPTLWLAGERGPGELRVHRGLWSEPIPLQAGPELSTATIRAACYFSGNVRLAWLDGTKLRDRAFTTQGAPAGEALDLGAFPAAPAPPIGNGTLLLLGVLGALLALNIMRADEETELSFGQTTMRLATLPRRLVAGAIDLLPLFMVILWRLPMRDSAAAGEVLRSHTFLAWLMVGSVIYLLHTTIGELITGRSIGKYACGLRVIGVDGNPPRALATLLRNAFRMIDVLPGLPLLLLILFTPLRQRLGDVVAGTVVVMDQSPAEQDVSREDSREDSAEG